MYGKRIFGVAAVAGLAGLLAGPARADLSCSMQFTMSGWSAFYKTYQGRGTVTCSDGSSMQVRLSSVGGGLTFGKSSIDDGHGDFVGVRKISEVLGDYAAGEAHGGAATSSAVTGLTKGEVSLSLKGKGRGWDAGVDFSKFTISAAPAQ